jgi:hypothetical protein
MPLVAALMKPVPAPAETFRSAPIEQLDLSGVYACEGVRPDGEVYRGVVEIVRHEETYRVRWVLPPAEQHLGLGLVAGDVLAVTYFGGLPGVVGYRIEHEGDVTRLVGRWAVLERSGRVFTEMLTLLPRGGQIPALPEDAPGSTHPNTRPDREAPVRPGRTAVGPDIPI